MAMLILKVKAWFRGMCMVSLRFKISNKVSVRFKIRLRARISLLVSVG
jgi:hypothetical protein